MFVCTKHPIRKRKTCPDCQKELKEASSQSNNTSIISKEEMEDNIINQLREEIVEDKIDYDKLFLKVEDLIKNNIKECYSKYQKEFEYKIRDLAELQYEHLEIPLKLFNNKLLYKLEKEGWGYKELFRGECARISAFKEDTVLLIRIKSNKWPHKPDFKEKK